MQKCKVKIKIGDLFRFLDIDDIDYDKFQKSNRKVKINSPDGYVDVNYFVKKTGKVYVYQLDNGDSIISDENHLIKQRDNTFKHISKANHVIIDGNEVDIIGQGYLYDGDVYDFSLDDPHEYITSAGVVCHNTTASKLIVNNIDCEYVYINGSIDNGIDTARNIILPFVSTYGFEDLKIVLIDEFDRFSPEAQDSLKSLMEAYAERARFILTCNHIEKIDDAIISRSTVYRLTPPSKEEVAEHMCKILDSEEVTYELDIVAQVVQRCYPDIRKSIQTLQRGSKSGVLKLSTHDLIDNQYAEKIIEVLCDNSSKKDKLKKIRQYIADSKRNDFSEMYGYLYERIEDYGTGNIGELILTIDEGQYKDYFVPDKQLHIVRVLLNILTII